MTEKANDLAGLDPILPRYAGATGTRRFFAAFAGSRGRPAAKCLAPSNVTLDCRVMADDKSAIFGQLRAILAKEAGGLDVRKDDARVYELYGKKTVETHGKTVEGMYFASVAMRKGGVSFYFFPIYTHPKEVGPVPAELKKCMNGKSCFQIKKEDATVYRQLRDLLKKGKRHYRGLGWV